MLDRIRIASPCSADWDLMNGDDQVRFCSHCEKHVYNLSAMSRKDAETLLRETGASVCTRFYRRPDGTILTEDCPVGLRAKAGHVRRRLEFAVSGFFALAGLSNAQEKAPSVQVEADSRPAIFGVVRDFAGAGIANAGVTLVSESGESLATTRSNAGGEFRLVAPEDGSYTIKVETPGFAIFKKDHVVIKREVHLEVTMQLGALMGEVVEIKKTSLAQKVRHVFTPHRS
jgi:hypothetical protein